MWKTGTAEESEIFRLSQIARNVFMYTGMCLVSWFAFCLLSLLPLSTLFFPRTIPDLSPLVVAAPLQPSSRPGATQGPARLPGFRRRRGPFKPAGQGAVPALIGCAGRHVAVPGSWFLPEPGGPGSLGGSGGRASLLPGQGSKLTDVPGAVPGWLHLLYLLPGVLRHEQVCPVCLEIYLPYVIPRVADVRWRTPASRVVEAGLGRDQQQLQAIAVFLILHNAAAAIVWGCQTCFWKEKIPPLKICSALFLLAAAGCLPFNDAQFDPDGYFWAVIHLLCVGAYQMVRQTRKSSALSDIDQQYLNYIFSVVLLAFASPPTGDLSSVLDFPYLYFYQFHGSCCASGVLGFFLMLSTVKLRSLLAPGQCAAWIFFAKVVTAALSLLLFDMKLTRATVGWRCRSARLQGTRILGKMLW
ncbi:UDP-N-acetylglucosamine transporter TMEM241 isoform X2 [Oryctolagus cuniculus]|uniref:UDP-N-acetylglucosamine transporter TMEM241 isoform X2 n=1 Tax=Oryctolagus cuniculus TaxID=9986 RepID=UPI00387A6A28